MALGLHAGSAAAFDLEGHRGLFLVGALSQSWGVTPEAEGKRIWARLVPASHSAGRR